MRHESREMFGFGDCGERTEGMKVEILSKGVGGMNKGNTSRKTYRTKIRIQIPFLFTQILPLAFIP